MKRIKFKTKYFLKANFRYLHNFFKPKNMYDIYTHILIHRHTNTHIYIYIHTYIYIYIFSIRPGSMDLGTYMQFVSGKVQIVIIS